MNRDMDWLTQARADLEHARHSLAMEDCEWACFAAQQSAEKAVESLHLNLGSVIWGTRSMTCSRHSRRGHR